MSGRTVDSVFAKIFFVTVVKGQLFFYMRERKGILQLLQLALKLPQHVEGSYLHKHCFIVNRSFYVH